MFQRPVLNTASDRLLDLDTGRNPGEDDHLYIKDVVDMMTRIWGRTYGMDHVV